MAGNNQGEGRSEKSAGKQQGRSEARPFCKLHASDWGFTDSGLLREGAILSCLPRHELHLAHH